MTISDILSVVGIIATIIFGIWGIVIVVRSRYPGEISFVRDPYLCLFESIVKNLPDLSVQYGGKPVSQGLVLIKGALLNSGAKDITEQMIEGKLQFVLPEKYRWITAKIVSSSPNVKASVDIGGQTMSFGTGLFRCNEFIRFQAIVEVPFAEQSDNISGDNIEEQLDNALSIKHRIADTKSVVVVDLPSTRLGKRRVGRLLLMSIFITIFVLLAPLIFFFIGLPADIQYTIHDSNGASINVSLSPRFDGSVHVKGVGNKYSQRMRVDEFFHTQKPVAKIVLSSDIKIMAIMGVIYLSFPWILWGFAYRERRKVEKLRVLLELEDC